MNTLEGSNDHEKLNNLCNKIYKEQGIAFLNAFWESFGQKEAERVWKCVQICSDLDIQRHGEGNSLDEVNAHRLIELLGETLTVVAMRDKLRQTGALGPTERPKLVPLVHYLLFKYNADWHVLVNAKEGNAEEIAKAQKLLDEAIVKANAAREAQKEADIAVREVKAQEDAYNNKTQEITQRTTQGGIVQQNKAKAELAQHLAEDPLPLRRAKITLEAALRKAESTLRDAERAVAEAEAYLADVSSRTGSPQGRLWWMQKELDEQKKYLPASRGGVPRNK